MVATHYYDVTVQGFIDYQTKYHDQFHLPILVTEFACQVCNFASSRSEEISTCFIELQRRRPMLTGRHLELLRQDHCLDGLDRLDPQVHVLRCVACCP